MQHCHKRVYLGWNHGQQISLKYWGNVLSVEAIRAKFCTLISLTTRSFAHLAFGKCGRARPVLAAYLDPRPTPLSIGLAYTRYYTHDQGDEKFDYVNLGLVRRIRRQLVNGYTNWRFGTKAEPSHPLGILAAFLVPGMRAQLATEYRNLPKKSPKGSKVLDIGCGDAAFLELARNCGWEVVGVDPDPRAVVVAQARGLDVRQGGVEIFNEQAEVFDIITLNNVVEHLHDPGAVLGACHRLLKPGGHIWLDTPNIDSPGHQILVVIGEVWKPHGT